MCKLNFCSWDENLAAHDEKSENTEISANDSDGRKEVPSSLKKKIYKKIQRCLVLTGLSGHCIVSHDVSHSWMNYTVVTPDQSRKSLSVILFDREV